MNIINFILNFIFIAVVKKGVYLHVMNRDNVCSDNIYRTYIKYSVSITFGFGVFE